MLRWLAAAIALLLLMSNCAQARVWLQAAGRGRLGGQLLHNPGLETAQASGRLAEGWFGWSKGKYELDRTVKHSGRFSARCRATEPGVQYGLGQTVELNQEVPTPLLARAWSRARDVSGSPDNNYSLYLDLEYMDGTPLWGQTTPFATGTHDWQQVQVLVMPEKPVKSVNVYGIFRGHSGTVWFDDFELYQLTGAGQFDLVAVVGELPRAAPRWQRLNIGPGPALLLDTSSGAMTLDGQRAGGIVLRDVAAASSFILPDLTVTRQGKTFRLAGDVSELGLRIDARLTDVGEALRLDATVADTTGRDRAVTVYWALPVGQGSWTWCHDPRTSRPAGDSSNNGNFIRVRAGANGLASRYPFGPICAADSGIALGAPITTPRLCRFGFDSTRNVLYAAFDLGLSQATSKSPGSASFSALLFGFPPGWRFRAALERYYELNEDAFVRRVDKQGIWMPFADISTVEGWEDFGFQFQEGAPNPAFDEEHGIYSFPYIEPMSLWMAMPPEMPREDSAALALLDRLAAQGNKRAIATKNSAIAGPSGKIAFSFHDTPWCNGALFLLNPDPDLPAPPDAPVTQYKVHEATINRVLGDIVGLTGWARYGAGYEIAADEGRGESACAKCVRGPADRPMGLRQTIAVNQKTPRPLVASAWSKARNVTGKKDGNYSLYLDITYRDGDHLWGQVGAFDVGTHDWQPVTVRVEPKKPVASVSLHLLFRGDHTGTVWFDDVSLREEGSERELVRSGDFDAPPRRVRIDGLYLDSFEMAATSLNYRRQHFASADLPLVFDSSGRVCQFGHFLCMELTMHVARMMHEQGRFMFANGVLHRFPWPAGWLDVFGTETNWNRGGRYSPPSDSTMLYWRAMCYKRPYLTLQNTDFDKFPPELVERYFARCCYYGILPSFFSPEASGRTSYWIRPDLYNRDRPLFKKYIPVIRRIAEAGWEPIPWANSNDKSVWVERFGEGRELFFTAFNGGSEPKSATITIALDKLGVSAARAEELLPRHRSLGRVAGKTWRWRVSLAPDQVAVLRLWHQGQ